jgi:hypothetical protein
MSALKAATNTDFEEWYDNNQPDDADQVRCLYRSLSDLSDEDWYKAKEIKCPSRKS